MKEKQDNSHRPAPRLSSDEDEEAKGFLAEYWFWMLLPLLLILGVLLYLVFGEQSDSQFIYSFW